MLSVSEKVGIRPGFVKDDRKKDRRHSADTRRNPVLMTREKCEETVTLKHII